jgi:hypothetical protein
MDGFPGTIYYYYEVKTLSERCVILCKLLGPYRQSGTFSSFPNNNKE